MVRMSTLNLRLAPMAGATNAPFRLVARACGAGLLTSEELDARALVEGNARTQVLAQYLPQEHPLAFQLLGGDPDVLAEGARRLEAAGADAIDLNMGCPVAKVVAKGHGAALMRDPLQAAVIFRTVRKAIGVPFTIKASPSRVMIGWSQSGLTAGAHQFSNASPDPLDQEGPTHHDSSSRRCGNTRRVRQGRGRAESCSRPRPPSTRLS